MPRSDRIPDVFCREHSSDRSSINSKKLPVGSSSNVFENFKALSVSSEGSYNRKPRETVAQRMFALHHSQPGSKAADGANKPATPMLGDSLLDPPQSLQMYHKRYQSPSRSGSPSLEAPDHLLSCAQKNCSRRYEKSIALNDFSEAEPMPCRECGHVSRQMFAADDECHRRDAVSRSYAMLKYNKCARASDPTPWTSKDAHSFCQTLNKQNFISSCGGNHPAQNFAPSFIQCLSDDKTANKWTKFKEKKLRVEEQDYEFPFRKPLSKLVTSEKPHYTDFTCSKKLSLDFRNKVTEESVKYVYHPMKAVDFEKRNASVQTDQSELGASLPHSKTWSMGLCHSPSNVSATSHQHVLKSSEANLQTKDEALSPIQRSFRECNEFDYNGHVIPSENQKAIFRRSLDSATSMVFHNRTSLPLTSSPVSLSKCLRPDPDKYIYMSKDHFLGASLHNPIIWIICCWSFGT